jgi:hypothetical protein
VRGEFSQSLSVHVVCNVCVPTVAESPLGSSGALPVADVRCGADNDHAAGAFPGQDEVLGSATIAEERGRALSVNGSARSSARCPDSNRTVRPYPGRQPE